MDLLLSGQATVIGGVLVDYGNVPEPIRPQVMQTLESALSLIARYEPRRVQRLARGGTRLLLMTSVGTSSYHPPSNIIVLDATGMARWSVGQAAVTIVHEATHARMRRIKANRRTIARLERRCVEEEIAFYRRIPRVDPELLTQWEAAKRAGLSTRWWTTRAKYRRFLRAVVREGNPGWFVRFLQRVV